MSCLGDQDVAALVAGLLPDAEAAHWEAHLAGCERCLRILSDSLRAGAGSPLPSPPAESTEPGGAAGAPGFLPAGARLVERYTVLSSSASAAWAPSTWPTTRCSSAAWR